MAKKDPSSKYYYFFDIDLCSRQIVSWDTDTQDQVEVNLKNGLHRVFVSKGQFNKLVAKLKEAQR